MPGSFGPQHEDVDTKLGVKVNDSLDQILQPGGQFMERMDEISGRMQKLRDGLNELTRGSG